MNGSARHRSRWTAGGPAGARRLRERALRVVPGATLLLVLAAPLAAQEAPSLLQLETRFTAAVADYEAALGAAAVQRQSWEEEVVALDQIRASGDDDTFDAAVRELERASLELQRAELRVRETEDAAEAAKVALLEGLDRRREDLEARYAAADDAVERQRIETLLLDVTAQYRTLENEPLSRDALQPLYSSITFDPRDQAPMLRFKIDLLERRIQMTDSTLDQVDRRIERLESLQRIQQMGEDFRAGVGRFDDDLLRTGPPPTRGAPSEGMPVDSTEVQEAVPLPRQIEEARLLKEWLVEFREELTRRVVEFRDRLRRITE